MNEETEPFEQRLKRQPLRPVPTDWRKEILSAVGEAQPLQRAAAGSENSILSNLSRRLAPILWPHPIAWGALAAVWILILGLNFSIRDEAPVVAEKIPPPSSELAAELRAQKRLYAELVGASADDSSNADRQKNFVPRPRSERIGLLTA